MTSAHFSTDHATQAAAQAAVPCRKVLVAGLGRGGTSSVASMLYHAGFVLSGAARPDAYFEDPPLRELLLERKFDLLRGRLELRCESHPLVAWKDPKLHGSQGREFVQMLPDDWIVIAIFRDPVALVGRRVVADRVEMADEFPKIMRALRGLHAFALEAETSGKQVVYLSYEKLMTDPARTIADTLGAIGIRVTPGRASYIWAEMQENRQSYLKTEAKKAVVAE